jgi:hypothetical protein
MIACSRVSGMLEGQTLACVRVTRRHALLAAAVMTLAPAVGRAEEAFQIRYTVERGGSGPVRVQGTVVNDARLDVYDVYVTAEALDAAGKVIGRGIVFVSGSIPARGSAPFVISIPAAQNAANFRVRVSSFRYGAGVQAG